VLVHNACSKWDITKNAKSSIKYTFQGKQMTAYQDKKGFYWAKDLAGHGGSAYKVYIKVGNEFRWKSDADIYGNKNDFMR
jgi:hypothetical protein